MLVIANLTVRLFHHVITFPLISPIHNTHTPTITFHNHQAISLYDLEEPSKPSNESKFSIYLSDEEETTSDNTYKIMAKDDQNDSYENEDTYVDSSDQDFAKKNKMKNSLPFILTQYPIGHKNNEKKKNNNISDKQ